MNKDKPRMIVEPTAGGIYIDGVLQKKSKTKDKPKKEVKDNGSGK